MECAVKISCKNIGWHINLSKQALSQPLKEFMSISATEIVWYTINSGYNTENCTLAQGG